MRANAHKRVFNHAFFNTRLSKNCACVLRVRRPLISDLYCSLCSKRFRGAKSEEWGFWCFARPKNGVRAKIGRRGWERRAEKTLADKALDFENLRSLANRVYNWLGESNIIDRCQSKVLKFQLPDRTFEACLQKVLTFLTERVFSCELRQYGRNPVVQCQRFGISKPDYYCRCNCNAICSCSFNFNITFLNVDLCQGRDNKPRDRKFALLRGETEWFCLACFMACLRILSCNRYSDISLEAFLLKEFRTSGYNSEGFVIVSRGMPVFITYLPYQIFSLLEHKDYTNVTWILLTDLC